MSKKRNNWMQQHIQTLKQRNAILTECCADWSQSYLAQMRHIQRLGGEVTALRRQVVELQKELMKRPCAI